MDENNKMTEEELIESMKSFESEFDILWTKIVSATNQYLKDNPEHSSFGMFNHSTQNRLEKFIDSLSMSGAWVHDRLNKKSGVYHNKNYRGSMSKRIRKALGYTY